MSNEINGELLQDILFAEENLIGSILISSSFDERDAIEATRKIVKPEDFMSNDFKRIYTAMLLSDYAPQITNTIQSLISNKIIQAGDLQLLRLSLANCECSLNYEWYAQNVKNYSTMRNNTKRINVKGAL